MANEVDVVEEVLDTSDNPNPFEEPTSYEGEVAEDTGLDWEVEAKKFQSIADKRQAELDSLKGQTGEIEKMGQLRDYLQSNPGLVEKMQDWIVSGGQEDSNADQKLSYDEFNPWDAYYKTDSPSYNFRVKQEKQLVGEAVQQMQQELKQEAALGAFVNELKGVHKLEDAEIGEFLNFVSQPKDKIDTSSLIKLWKENTGQQVETQNALDAVRKNKQSPNSPGVLQGGGERTPKSENDKMWDRILKAGSRSNVL